MPVDPRPPIGAVPARHLPVAPPNAAADQGFRVELAEAAAREGTAPEPAPRRGLDARERSQGFVRRELPLGADRSSWMFGEDGFDFGDLIDVINPLQHIPVVSSIYRWLTGDEISPAARLAGGTLFGGPIGLAGSVASLVIDETTGRDLGEHAMAMVFGATEEEEEAPPAGPEAGNLADAGTLAPEMPAAVPEATATAAASPMAPPDDGRRFIALQPAAGAPHAARFIPVASLAPQPPTAQPRPSTLVPPPMDRPAQPQAGIAEAESFGTVVAEDMMRGLDKYQALLRSREAGRPTPPGPAPGSLFDASI